MNQNLTKQPVFWYSIYYGITTIVVFTIIYAINFEFFGHFFKWILINIAILVAFMVMGGMAQRKFEGGYLKYLPAVKSLFIIGLNGYIINLIFIILFVNFIDTEYNKNLSEVVKESTMQWMQSMDVPDEKVDEAIERIDSQMEGINSPMYYVKQLFSSSGMSLIFALICAIFVRKNPPEDFTDTELIDSAES